MSIAMLCGVALYGAAALTPDPEVRVLSRVPGDAHSSPYVGSAVRLYPGSMVKLPVASFKPTGWLGKFLELQRDGLTGKLGEISVWLTKENNAWLAKDGSGKYGWEEVPYWLRGYSRIGYVLGDDAMTRESRVWIEGVLSSQRENGDFGPIQMKHGKRDLWAQMLMLQVLQSYHEYSGDPRVVPFMTRYFKWQLTVPDSDFLKDYWENSRGGDNLASVYWLYNITAEEFLLELGKKIDKNTADWRMAEGLPNWHGVNIAESFRAPATYWRQSRKAADLDASVHVFDLVREKYGQVPGGMFGADENARPGYSDPHQATETCTFVEQLQSNRIMAEITGDPRWAGNSEDFAFNMMPAAFMPDYRSLRYLTAPNQVVSDAANHAPGIENDGPFLCMNPFSSRCCQHNHSSAWVNYVENAWMGSSDGGLVAELYASGEVTAKVRGGVAKLVTETEYPFRPRIGVMVEAAPAEAFPIYFRIPAWAVGSSIQVNDHSVKEQIEPGSYVRISNAWKRGDIIVVTLPMKAAVKTWEKNKSGATVMYGPLAFSLKIDEKYQKIASDKTAMNDSGWQKTADPMKWPSFEILPGSAWNYSLDVTGAPDSLGVVKKEWPKDDQPFTNAAAPLEIHVKGRRLPSWTLDKHGLCGELPRSPVVSDSPVEDLTLVPMGGARLRVSVFPTVAK